MRGDIDSLLETFAESTAAGPFDVPRLKARVAAAQRARARRRMGFGVGALVALGAAIMVFAMPDGPPAPEPVSATLTASNAAAEVVPGVVLTSAGEGRLTGTTTAPRLAWSSGRVDVSVEPGAGLDVRIHTEEAAVSVVGTVFSVDRTALGTTVEVSRGEVAVACEAGGQHSVTPGQSVTCLPTSAAGLLGRARHLRDSSGSQEDVLAAISAGLGHAPDAVVRSELTALKVEALFAAGDAPHDVIDAARAHLADPTSKRRAEVARIGATVAYTSVGCAGVGPFISELPAEEVAASALARCEPPAPAP